MFIFRQAVIIIGAFVAGLAVFFIDSRGHLGALVGLGALVIVALTAPRVIAGPTITLSETFRVFSPHLAMLMSAWLTALFLPPGATRTLLAISVMAVSYLYSNSVFKYFHFAHRYSPSSLSRMAGGLLLFSFFAVASAVHGVRLLFHAPLVLILTVAFFCFALILYIWALTKELPLDSAKWYCLTGALVLTEIEFAALLLPFSYFMGGAILSVGGYVVLRSVSADQVITERSLPRLGFIAIIVLLFLLVFADWR